MVKQARGHDRIAVVPDRWYGVLEGRALRGRPVVIRRLGEELVLYRTAAGEAVCMLNRCPHRGMGLQHGRVFGDQIECPYHGFRYDPRGACTLMPCEGQDAAPPPKLKAVAFPTREAQGLIWIWWGREAPAPALPALPWPDDLPATPHTYTTSFNWPVPHALAIEAGIDAHHAPTLHGQRRGTKGWKIPIGRMTRVERIDLKTGPDWLNATYHFQTEPGARKPGAYQVVIRYKEPGMIYAEIAGKLRLFTVDTPVDSHNTWRIIRYFQMPGAGPMIGSALARLTGVVDMAMVQWDEDYWVLKSHTPPRRGVLADHMVRSDAAVNRFRAMQRRLLGAAMAERSAYPPIVRDHLFTEADAVEAGAAEPPMPTAIAV